MLRLILFWLLLLAAWGPQAGQETCPTDRVDAWARVAYVFDGDTVQLGDGSRVRLIGLDTPELGRDGKPSQPYAVQARKALQRLLGTQAKVGLRYDVERYDPHGRQLAHLYLADGTNVQRALLDAGLATTLVIPPNLWQQACYAKAEARARAAERRLWRLGNYRPIDAAHLPLDSHGYRVVRGRVRKVGQSQNSLWLNLTRRVAVRIDKADLELFRRYSPRTLGGQRVEARGFVQARRGRLQMRIRHPDALVVID